MALGGEALLLLRVVRSEEIEAYPAMLGHLRRQFPGMPVVWATTGPGAALLEQQGLDARILRVTEGGLSPFSLPIAARRVRALAPAACVIAYENPERRGNLVIEALAAAGRPRRLYETLDGEKSVPLSRGRLALRILRGGLAATALAGFGLAAGLFVLAALPLGVLLRFRGRSGACGGPDGIAGRGG